MAGPLFFIHTLGAKVVLGSTLAGAMLMMFIFSRYGFVRLMGLGHIFWIPLVIWLGTRTSEMALDTPFGIWLALVLGANIVSLYIDILGVTLYLREDRKPMSGPLPLAGEADSKNIIEPSGVVDRQLKWLPIGPTPSGSGYAGRKRFSRFWTSRDNKRVRSR